MNATHQTLAGLLLVQLGLAAFTWSGAGPQAAPGKHKLIDWEKSTVTALEIHGAPSEKDQVAPGVKLVKQGDAWVVASAGDYPAEASKVDEVLGKLLDLEVAAPIATHKANHNALRVGDRDFDRTIVVTAGDRTVKLVLGSAKGTSLNVRKADEESVFWAKGVSTWNLSERAASYVNTELVKFEDPTSVTVKNATGEFVLLKDADGDWKVSSLPPEAPLKQSDIQSFVGKLSRITLSAPVGKGEKPEYQLDEGVTVSLEKTVAAAEAGEGEKKEGQEAQPAAPQTQRLIYRIGPEVDGKYYARVDGNDYVVEVSKWAVEKLLTQKADEFLKTDES